MAHRHAIAVSAEHGRLVSSRDQEGIEKLRRLASDLIANGEWPADITIFRIPRRLQAVRINVNGPARGFDRECPHCKCGMRWHNKPCI